MFQNNVKHFFTAKNTLDPADALFYNIMVQARLPGLKKDREEAGYGKRQYNNKGLKP